MFDLYAILRLGRILELVHSQGVVCLFVAMQRYVINTILHHITFYHFLFWFVYILVAHHQPLVYLPSIFQIFTIIFSSIEIIH